MRICLYTITAATFLAFVATTINAQSYVTPSPRRSPSCALLSGGKIHCFGGQTGAGQSLQKDATLFTLDTTKIQDNFATQWEQITDSINSEIYTTYPRARAIVAVTEDKKNMIITGGQTSTTNVTVFQNLVYNVDTKTWRALPTFDDGVNGNSRQIYVGASTWVPDQSKVYFFGGTEIDPSHSWYYDNVLETNLTDVLFASDSNSSKIGYYRMTTLDITQDVTTPWQVPTQQNPPTLSYYMQAPVYHPTSKKIFYFGGLVNNATTEQRVGTKNVSMSEALTFDTVNNVWETQIFTGDLIPSVRRSHTVTLLPSGQDILLYGGTANDQLSGVQDFCYTASLETFIWTSCNTIALENNNPPYRTEHAAVLDESKKIVYILFGYQDTKANVNTFNTVLALNVTDPKKVEFVTTSQDLFTSAEEPLSATDSEETASKNSDSTNNSNGTIIGGAVGGSVGGLLLIGVVTFLIIRKNKSNENKNLAKQQEEENAEHLSVDWDAIEGGYTETCPLPVGEKDKKHHSVIKPYNNQKSLVIENGSATTTVASLLVPDVNANENALVPDGGAHSELMNKPDVYIGNDK